MKTLIAALIIVIVCLCILCATLGSVTTLACTEFILLDRVELQEYLNTKGYGLKVDGKIGPETIKAWDEHCTINAKIDLDYLK